MTLIEMDAELARAREEADQAYAAMFKDDSVEAEERYDRGVEAVFAAKRADMA